MSLCPETLSELPPSIAWSNGTDGSEFRGDFGKSSLRPPITGFELHSGHRSLGSQSPRVGDELSKAAAPGGSGVVTTKPDSEVSAYPSRRRFTAAYKLEVLRQADACRKSGEVGALLRREGLYSSHLSAWRLQREQGGLREFGGRKRGRRPQPPNPLAARVAELEREKRKLQRRLHRAETIIDIQKKTSALLGIPLKNLDNESDD
jgi:transposase-like protein